jgi:hypothetical protein
MRTYRDKVNIEVLVAPTIFALVLQRSTRIDPQAAARVPKKAFYPFKPVP